MTAALLLFCRPGFEKELTAELYARLGEQGMSGHVRAQADSGLVEFEPHEQLLLSLPLASLCFARQRVYLLAPRLTLTAGDRITPLLEALRASGERFRELRLETADTNEAKALAGFLKKFAPPLQSVLQKQQLLHRSARKTLHLCFLDSTQVYIGWTDPGDASPWEGGIPRLKFPQEAPSRSTLKLEEGLLTLVDDATREAWLRPGCTAVDLGAAPGGWTWQLVKRGLQVTAIDNGAMDAKLMASGQVEHLRVDGFRYRPERPVNWLVCDMIEQPARIAVLMAGWLADGDAERALFNLKLPMKKRFDELERCKALIDDTLGHDRRYQLSIKQLYHDREEVTAYLRF